MFSSKLDKKQNLPFIIAYTVLEYPPNVCKNCIDEILEISRMKLKNQSFRNPLGEDTKESVAHMVTRATITTNSELTPQE